MIFEEVFKEILATYKVKSPIPTQCFRSITQQICKVHEITSEILTSETILQIFTKINDIFKIKLSKRLKDLKIVNNGGKQHAYGLYFQANIF